MNNKAKRAAWILVCQEKPFLFDLNLLKKFFSIKKVVETLT